MDGESHGDQLLIGGPSLSDSSPLLKPFASHILADGWSTLRLVALCAFLYTTPEGLSLICDFRYIMIWYTTFFYLLYGLGDGAT